MYVRLKKCNRPIQQQLQTM